MTIYLLTCKYQHDAPRVTVGFYLSEEGAARAVDASIAGYMGFDYQIDPVEALP